MSAEPTDPLPTTPLGTPAATPATAPTAPTTPTAPPGARDASGLVAGALVVAALVIAGFLVVRGQGSSGGPVGPADDPIARLIAKSDELARAQGVGPVEVMAPLLEAYQLDPKDARINSKLGDALFLQDRHQEALPHLTLAAERAPDDYPAHLELGVCLMALTRYDDARAPLQRARELAPANDERPLYYLGLGAKLRRDPAAAIDFLRACVRIAPRHLVALRLLAESLDELGRDDEAIAPLVSLSLLVPGDVRLRREIDERRVARDGFAAVTSAACARASASGGTTVDAYMAGRLLAQDHRTAREARALYERALVLDKTNPWPALGLAVEDARDGKEDEARAGFEALLKRLPDFDDAEAQLLLLEQRRGDVAAVASHAGRLLASGHATALAREALVEAQAQAGHYDEAEALARELIRPGAPPGDPTHFLLAEVLGWRGQFDAAGEALAAMREAAPPGQRAPLWGLEALNELDAGREDAARKAYDAALADVPAGVRPPVRLLLWSGVARALTDPAAARDLWERGATTGALNNPDALFTWACRRLIGQAAPADVLAAARFEGPFSKNDALFVEGLACELAGDLDAARVAYAAARDVTIGTEHPRRLIERAILRIAKN